MYSETTSAIVGTTDEYSARAVVSRPSLSPDNVDSDVGVCISLLVQTLQIRRYVHLCTTRYDQMTSHFCEDHCIETCVTFQSENELFESTLLWMWVNMHCLLASVESPLLVISNPCFWPWVLIPNSICSTFWDTHRHSKTYSQNIWTSMSWPRNIADPFHETWRLN